ncbi:MAG: hypothetical protein IJ246_09295 [Clostridia bacterium]|nr:hypothetical protein [Clostridia bacterium]
MNKGIYALHHAIVILSLMFLVFLVLDQFNPLMNFVNNGISQTLLAILCVLGILRSILAYRDSATEKEVS